MPLDRVPLLKVKGKGIALERASPPQGNQKGKGKAVSAPFRRLNF